MKGFDNRCKKGVTPAPRNSSSSCAEWRGKAKAYQSWENWAIRDIKNFGMVVPEIISELPARHVKISGQ